MADGRMECVPKKEIKECFFFIFIFFYSVEEDGNHAGGESVERERRNRTLL